MPAGSSATAWLGGTERPGANAGFPLTSGQDRGSVLLAAMAALVILVLLGPLMTVEEAGITGDGSATRQIGYLIILGMTVYAILPTVTRASAVAMPWPFLVAFAWAWLSVSWAIDPGVSVRRVVLTTIIAWMVFAQVRHAGYRTGINVLRACFAGAVLICYVVVFVDPVLGRHVGGDEGLGGLWRGFFGHKNNAGAVCALCIILFLFDAGEMKRWLRVGVLLLAGYFLWRTQSKTSGGMVLLASLGGVMFQTMNQRLRAYLIPALIVVTSGVWLLANIFEEQLVGLIVNPKAFTGRVHIWNVLLNYAWDHPLFGAGFGSFWNIDGFSPVYQYGQGFITTIVLGHSGYIDQLITVGVPGLLLMIGAAVVWPFWRLLASPTIAAGRGAMIAALLMFCVGHNLTESGLFERDVIVSTIFFFAVAFAQDATAGDRRERGAGKRERGGDLLREMRRRGSGKRRRGDATA